MWITVNRPAIKALGIESVFGAIKAIHASLGLNPDFTIFPNMTESAGLRVDDSYLSADGNHARILDQEGGGVCVGIDRVDETTAKSAGIEPQFNGFDAHV